MFSYTDSLSAFSLCDFCHFAIIYMSVAILGDTNRSLSASYVIGRPY